MPLGRHFSYIYTCFWNQQDILEKNLFLSSLSGFSYLPVFPKMDHQNELSNNGSHNKVSNMESNTRKQLLNRGTILQNDREDVNKMADAFIRNFRNQLKIEREE
ncbi:hypothetical protein L6164_025365 [Bauhinia variegata]|uniref:Uncharacterized protein n=1 Tax=Bauhinia variegata TaxID=167791 RepID=A0ACB9M1Q4_BAUVA|nr:hypothetical protein L6164_025365 [Bauhinia variegata]